MQLIKKPLTDYRSLKWITDLDFLLSIKRNQYFFRINSWSIFYKIYNTPGVLPLIR